MKLVVRLDVSTQLGTGHWRRMGNLVGALPGAQAVFALRTDQRGNPLFSGSAMRFLDEVGLDEGQALRKICEEERADLLLLDLLRYPPGLVEHLRQATRRKIVSFHEYSDWGEASDLAVNYNTFDGFEAATARNLLAGPKYCILSRELLNTERHATTSGVLVMFGGSDPSGFTETFLERVADRLPHIPFMVHVGPFFARERCALAGQAPGHIHFTGPADSFFDLLSSCRLVATAGGNSMYEAIYCRLVPLVLAHNAHQAEFARNAARLGACYHLGTHPDVNWEAVRAAIERDYQHPPSVAAPLVDGLGVQRLVQHLLQLCE